jgi:hypothetical protein
MLSTSVPSIFLGKLTGAVVRPDFLNISKAFLLVPVTLALLFAK